MHLKTVERGMLNVALLRHEAAGLGKLLMQALGATDMLQAMLRRRADELADCTEGSPEEAELAAIAGLLDVYDTGATTNGGSTGLGNG